MTKAQIELPEKMVANFAQPARHRIFKGGRGSAKTRGLAKMAALKVYQLAEAGKTGVWLCSREHLNSLDESSLEEIKHAIRSEPFLNAYFEIGEKYVRTKNRRIAFAFAGLRHNLNSIKSKANILGNWTDEAEGVSEAAWRKLIPTIRADGSENWVSYNPESADSATHKRFIINQPDSCIVTEMNYRDNPWFPAELEGERLDDLKYRPETYQHVWEGSFLTITDAQIFAGHFEELEFEPSAEWAGPYCGLDWGFSQDPTAAVQCYVRDNCLYIRREAGKVKLDLDDTAQFIDDRIHNFGKHVIRADSARPESISHLKKQWPHIVGVKKGPGSVEDGIAHIKSYKRVYIHPDCPDVAREFRVYSYKVDRQSGDITTAIVDADNHYIDAIRYALRPLMGSNKSPRVRSL